MEAMKQVVSEAYYLSHFMAFFSYFIVRSSAAAVLSPHIIRHLFYREIQAVLALSLLAAIKITREETWEEFIDNTLFYAKVLLVAIASIMDYHLALWFLVVFLVIYILTQQPVFRKLGTSNKLTPLQLEALLTEGKTSRYWLVEFRAQCSSTCIRASRVFPELSITYSNKNVSFGIVDLGLFPNAAEKFGISLGGSLGQLPTYILFENNTEINRFPAFNFEEKHSHPHITKGVWDSCLHIYYLRIILRLINFQPSILKKSFLILTLPRNFLPIIFSLTGFLLNTYMATS